MSYPRSSGILLHPTSLPDRFGMGDLGPSAYRFADFLHQASQRVWQMLPLNPPGYENSPYQCLSSAAGSPLLISPERLAAEGLLTPKDLEAAPDFPETNVDFDRVIPYKIELLQKSYELFKSKTDRTQREHFNNFCEQNAAWLDTYSLFIALKEKHRSLPWNEWDADIKNRQPEAIANYAESLHSEIEFHKYVQYQFFKQWGALKAYCNNRGIRIMGDIPIYVALDSDTVWAHPDQFQLDANGKPTVIAGVPPDYFSTTGQLWGNPLYRWDRMANDGFRWWIDRMQRTQALFDIIRLDHFRGFEKYWEVPATHNTAIRGQWVPGPGIDLFAAIEKALGRLPLVAEDLGAITDEVLALRDELGFPGLKVLQFAFGDDSPDNPHRPYNYPRNCVVYTGTHDNNTTIGWFRENETSDTTQGAAEKKRERERVLSYLGTDGSDINWDLIRLALSSVADTAIIPLQDVIGLGSKARMNFPGRPKGNWRWRFTESMLTENIVQKLGNLTKLYGRAS